MNHNNFVYYGFHFTGFKFAEKNGWDLRKSEDGVYGIGDRGESICVECPHSPPPPYATDEIKDAWPYLTHEQALQILSVQSSSPGSGDGWYYPRND